MSNDNIESIMEWAGRNFPKRFDLEKGDFLLLVIILLVPFYLFYLVLLADNIFRGKSVGGLDIVTLILNSGLILYLAIRRRRIAIQIDNEGVTTKSGKKLLWSKLLSAEFKSLAKQSVGGSIGIDREKFQTVLNFENGVAIILYQVELEARLLNIPINKTDSRGNLF